MLRMSSSFGGCTDEPDVLCEPEDVMAGTRVSNVRRVTIFICLLHESPKVEQHAFQRTKCLRVFRSRGRLFLGRLAMRRTAATFLLNPADYVGSTGILGCDQRTPCS